jgi:hypothetical protein
MGLTDHYEELAFTLSGKEDHSKQRNDKIWLKFYLFIYLFFLWYWGLNSGFTLATQALYYLNHGPSPLRF